jgi:hypothetical protein
MNLSISSKEFNLIGGKSIMKRERNLKEFAISLKKLMSERKNSVEDFANDADISKSFAYRLLQQTRRPSRNHVLILGITMGLTVKEINYWLELTGHDLMTKKNVPIREKEMKLSIAQQCFR